MKEFLAYKLTIHNLTKYQANTLKNGIKLDKRIYPITVKKQGIIKEV